MNFKDYFKQKPKYITLKNITFPADHDATVHPGQESAKRDVPNGLWVKCESCATIIYHKDLERNLKTCPKCNYHFRIKASERLALFVDPDSFQELFRNIKVSDPLQFPGYREKVRKYQTATSATEAVVTGTALVEAFPCAIGVMDFFFAGGSMGSVVGEKLTRLFEYAIDHRLPVILFVASGGARMHEGIFSLMQMAKVGQMVTRLSREGLLFVPILTDPTSGGVFASFASQGDLIIAEPKAYIGFAGQIVINQTIKQQLPADYQRAEFVLEHGIIDQIVDRKDLRAVIARILALHQTPQPQFPKNISQPRTKVPTDSSNEICRTS